MKKTSRNYLLNLIGTLVLSIVLWLLNQRLYVGIITKLPMLMLNLWFVMSLINYPKDETEQNSLRFGIFIWILSVLVFFVQKPKLSFDEAQSVAQQEGLKNIQEIETKFTEDTKLPTQNTLIKVYLVKGELEGEGAYVLVSPINGATEVVYLKDKNLED